MDSDHIVSTTNGYRAVGTLVPISQDRCGSLDDLLTVSQMQLQLEETKTEGIHARGVGLGGFASVVLSLLTLTVTNDLRSSTESGIADTSTYMLVGALMILCVSLALIIGVIWPYHRRDISAHDLDTWRMETWGGGDLVCVRMNALRHLGKAIRCAAAINRRKGHLLAAAAIVFAGAMALSAVAGAVIALEL